MARQLSIYCDKCGERITQDCTLLVPKTGAMRHREPFDLCSTCADELLEWFGPICGRKPVEGAPAGPATAPAPSSAPNPRPLATAAPASPLRARPATTESRLHP
jgi:hypothetical protein